MRLSRAGKDGSRRGHKGYPFLASAVPVMRGDKAVSKQENHDREHDYAQPVVHQSRR